MKPQYLILFGQKHIVYYFVSINGYLDTKIHIEEYTDWYQPPSLVALTYTI